MDAQLRKEVSAIYHRAAGGRALLSWDGAFSQARLSCHPCAAYPRECAWHRCSKPSADDCICDWLIRQAHCFICMPELAVPYQASFMTHKAAAALCSPEKPSACTLQAMLQQQQELAQLVADFEATQAQSEAALARLARGDPGGHLAQLQVRVNTCTLC